MEENEFTNADKKEHGDNGIKSLDYALSALMKKKYLNNVEKGKRMGRDGYYDKQFLAQFLIELPNGFEWVVYTSTSMRSDRIKGNQWDAYNLRAINQKIKKVFMVYADSMPKKDIEQFKSQNLKYTSHKEYSAIDGVISIHELEELIKAQTNDKLPVGVVKDKEGREFEVDIARILSSTENLKKWKSGSPKITGVSYLVYNYLVENLGIDKESTYEITASSDIPKLPSGGSPKTDVIVRVLSKYGDVNSIFTISCKKTSSDFVSGHQYSADAFADVLDSKNAELRSALRAFQEAGGVTAMGLEMSNKLESSLKPYVSKLVDWVISGKHGMGDPDTQWATHILTLNSEGSLVLHSVEEYSSLLQKDMSSGQLGTPFKWTFASKQKGKSIQLKMKIIE